MPFSLIDHQLALATDSDVDRAIVMVDYVPLDREDVRQVILHLKRLAEHSVEDHRKRPLALPASEDRGPLWDRELDG